MLHSTKLLFTLGLVSLSGCASRVSYEWVNAPPSPIMMAKPVDAVEVLTVPPSRPYVEVGALTVNQPGDTDALRKEAAQRGCDAIVLHERDFGHGTVMVDSAACLVYTAAKPPSR